MNSSPAAGRITPAFKSHDGLAALTATLADVDTILVGLVAGQFVRYRVAIDSGSEEWPGRVAPANHHPTLNPVLFIQC